MLVWCFVLLALGVAAFFDSLFNYGEIFRRVNAMLFMLVSLGLLVRTMSQKSAQSAASKAPRRSRQSTQPKVLQTDTSPMVKAPGHRKEPVEPTS
jgi:cation transport ATPase